MTNPRILLAGCGDIAQRLALLLHQDYALTGLRRQPQHLPDYIAPIAADLCDSTSLAAALQDQTFDYVVITLTPGERTAARYQAVYVDGTRHLLAALKGKPRLLFVSSTSVYAQHNAEIIDENSLASGSGFSGQSLLAAEALIHHSGLPSTCVRFSGIYGPGRERLIRQVRERRVDLADAPQYSNRIHADDCARVLAFLIERWEDGHAPAPCYVASDIAPTQQGHVWQWMTDTLQMPSLLADTHWQQQPASGKRCNSLLLQQQGFHFLYPDFQSGYLTLIPH